MRLRAKLSKKGRTLQARESKLSGELQKANARCAEPERSLELSKPRLQKLEGDLAKLRAEHSKAFEDLADRHGAESSNQNATVRQEARMLKKTCRQGKEEVRRLQEIAEHEQQKSLSQRERLV